MTVAVTGAAGFVGTYVLRALVARGEPVVGVVRRSPKKRVEGVDYVQLDLADADESTFDRLGKPERLIHLAWGGLPNYLSFHHFETELPLQYRFLSLMAGSGLRSLLVTGTCYEYGMVNGALEETMVERPNNPYAFAKVALLRQLVFLKSRYEFGLTWARLFYIWGEGQAPTSIYPLLMAAITRGDHSFPMSAGEQLRDYLPVEEVAAMLAELSIQYDDAGVVNISSGQPVSIRALVERWIAQAGSSMVPDLGRYPYPRYEPLAFWGSATKRRHLLPDR